MKDFLIQLKIPSNDERYNKLLPPITGYQKQNEPSASNTIQAIALKIKIFPPLHPLSKNPTKYLPPFETPSSISLTLELPTATFPP